MSKKQKIKKEPAFKLVTSYSLHVMLKKHDFQSSVYNSMLRTLDGVYIPIVIQGPYIGQYKVNILSNRLDKDLIEIGCQKFDKVGILNLIRCWKTKNQTQKPAKVICRANMKNSANTHSKIRYQEESENYYISKTGELYKKALWQVVESKYLVDSPLKITNMPRECCKIQYNNTSYINCTIDAAERMINFLDQYLQLLEIVPKHNYEDILKTLKDDVNN